MPGSISRQPPKLLEQVRPVLRLPHSSIHTARAYLEWIVRYVRFHRMRSRDDLFPPEPNIEAFLTDLAVHGTVAAATQTQAMNALVFLYKRVLNHTLEGRINFERKAGYFRETAHDAVMEKVDGEGNLLGFSILKVSALKGEPPLSITLKKYTG